MTSEPCAQSQTSLHKIRVGPAWSLGMCGLNCTCSFNYHSLSNFLNILIQKIKQKRKSSVSQPMADISDALTTYLSPGQPGASLGRKLNVLYNHDSAGASDRAIPLLVVGV